MLPITTDTATIPNASEVLGLLEDYADALDAALEQTPRVYKGPVYLPTRRAIRSSVSAAELVRAAAGALEFAGALVRPVPVPGGWSRPIDVVDLAITRLGDAWELVEQHQRQAPGENVAGLVFLAEWLRIAHHDLSALLGPLIELMGMPEGE